MEIASEFSVGAGAGRPSTRRCSTSSASARAFPGRASGRPGADGAHPAEIAVRLGPMRLTYRGTVRVVERDDAAARTATLVADVREVRGQGNATRADDDVGHRPSRPGAHVERAIPRSS